MQPDRVPPPSVIREEWAENIQPYLAAQDLHGRKATVRWLAKNSLWWCDEAGDDFGHTVHQPDCHRCALLRWAEEP